MSVPVLSGSAETVKHMHGAPQSAQERIGEPIIRACWYAKYIESESLTVPDDVLHWFIIALERAWIQWSNVYILQRCFALMSNWRFFLELGRDILSIVQTPDSTACLTLYFDIFATFKVNKLNSSPFYMVVKNLVYCHLLQGGNTKCWISQNGLSVNPRVLVNPWSVITCGLLRIIVHRGLYYVLFWVCTKRWPQACKQTLAT